MFIVRIHILVFIWYLQLIKQKTRPLHIGMKVSIVFLSLTYINRLLLFCLLDSTNKQCSNTKHNTPYPLWIYWFARSSFVVKHIIKLYSIKLSPYILWQFRTRWNQILSDKITFSIFCVSMSKLLANDEYLLFFADSSIIVPWIRERECWMIFM